MSAARTEPVLVHPASHAQQQLWFLDQLEPGQPVYNINVRAEVPDLHDPAVTQRALNELVRRHEILRTTFEARDGVPMQVVARELELPLPVTDLRELPTGERERAVTAIATAEAAAPFDLAAGPLLRAHLLRLPDHVQLILIVHHIVADAWSIKVLLDELRVLCRAFEAGRPSPLAPLRIQYADYTAWQARLLDGPALERSLDFWRLELKDLPELDLPSDRPRPAVLGSGGGEHAFTVPAGLAADLVELGRRQKASLFMVLLAAFEVLLYRWSNQTDVVVGSPVAGRGQEELQGLIGLFVNRLVLRTDLSGDPTFAELLGRVRHTVLRAFAHQDVPFETLVDELQPERRLSRAPLFQVGFNLIPLIVEGARPGVGQYGNGTVRHDLNLEVAETTQGLGCRLEYRTDLFEHSTAVCMAGQLATLLAAVAADPNRPIGRLPLLEADERERLLAELRRPAPPRPAACVHRLFEAQAARMPRAPAVSFEQASLGFEELNRRANQVAHHLRGLGVGPEVCVGLCLDRSLELPVGVLAVLKAGGAFVALDPAGPPARLAAILAETGARVVLVAGEPPPLPEGVTVVHLDRDWPAPTAEEAADPDSGVGPDNLAYVLYTSGSTGRPKGVAVEHRQLHAYLRAVVERVGFRPGGRYAMVQPLTFDACLTMLFPPLVVGGCLLVVGPDEARDPARLAARFRRERPDYLKITPSHLAALQSGGDPAAVLPQRALVVGGEASVAAWLAELTELADCQIYTHYGPTEATVGVTAGRVTAETLARQVTSPLGEPLAGARVYLLDGDLQPLPTGVRGELYLGGATVARGYLGRPALTAERFLPDPYDPAPGARMYRTGDVARRVADGTLEFLGRSDEQLKIRGFRIEPGEVEAVLTEHPAVREAVVAAKQGTTGTARLVAYVVPAGAPPDAEALRGLARQQLPEHMVPAAVVVLDELPLTRHGKADRAALPDPEELPDGPPPAPAMPRTPVEATLAAIWAEVLGQDRVGPDDNFFQLGGDSILSIRVVARARRAGLSLTPKQLFQCQTVAELAAVAEPVGVGQAEQAAVSGPLPPTPAQAALLAGAADPDRFSQAVMVDLAGPVDPGRLEQALGELVAHHDGLRLRAEPASDGWRLWLAAAADPVRLELVDLAGTPADEQPAAMEAHAARLEGGLDLGAGRVVRAALFDLGARPPRLLLLVHQLAVDALSWRILLEDLEAVEGALARGQKPRLEAKTTSVKAWAELLVEEAASAATAAEAGYWLAPERALAHPLPTDPAPDDGGAQNDGGAPALWIALEPDETRALVREVPAAYGNQVAEVLLAALGLAVAGWASPGPLPVEVETAGRVELRPGVDLSRTVGWFTATFPLLLDLDPAEGPGAALRTVKERLRTVPREGIGYGLLRTHGPDPGLRARLDAQPPAEIGFSFLGRLDRLLGGLDRFGRRPPELRQRRLARHPIDVDAVLEGGRLRVGWTTAPGRFRAATVERLAGRFLEELRSLIDHAQSPDALGYTPSDFPQAGLDQAGLDELVRSLGMGAGPEEAR